MLAHSSPQVDARGTDSSSCGGGSLPLRLNYLTRRRACAVTKAVRKSEFGRWNPYNSFRNLPLPSSADHTVMEYGRPLPTARSTARTANQPRRLHSRGASISGWSTRFRQTPGPFRDWWIAFPPRPINQGSQVKVMFSRSPGPVLGAAEMLSPLTTTQQPFRFVSLPWTIAADWARQFSRLCISTA